jgi:hypothetical protein
MTNKDKQKLVQHFLLKGCNEMEIISYKKYIDGDESNILWIKKTCNNRDKILYFEPKCNSSFETQTSICNNYINISEKGICKCNNNHNGIDKIILILKKISNSPVWIEKSSTFEGNSNL